MSAALTPSAVRETADGYAFTGPGKRLGPEISRSLFGTSGRPR